MDFLNAGKLRLNKQLASKINMVILLIGILKNNPVKTRQAAQFIDREMFSFREGIRQRYKLIYLLSIKTVFLQKVPISLLLNCTR